MSSAPSGAQRSARSDARAPRDRVFGLLGALFGAALLSLVVPVPSVIRGIAGYPALHMALETFAIVVSALIFAVGSRRHGRELPRNVVLLSGAFLGVAILDFSHALSYAGMPEYVTPGDPEKAIGFWFAARLLASVAVLVVALAPWRTPARETTQRLTLGAVLSAVAAVHAVLFFRPDLVPRTFIAGHGLTPFKVGFEYGLIGLNVVAAVALLPRLRRPEGYDAASLFACVCTMAMSEQFFTRYADVADLYNLLGHLYKVAAYLFLYRAIVVDTIERPYAELRAAQARLRTILQTIPDALWLKDLEGRIIDCNPTVEHMLGRPREAIVGTLDLSLGDSDRAIAGREHDAEALRNGGPVARQRPMRVGDADRPFEVIKTPMRDDRGEVVGVLGVGRDLSAMLRDQEALRVSEQRLRQAVRTASIGIFDHDHVGDTIYWSPEQRRHYGLGDDEPVTLASFVHRVHPADRERIAAAVARAHDPAGDGLFDVEHRIVRPDGEVRLLATRSQTFFEGEGAQRRKRRTVGAVTDVTERRAAEQALQIRDEALRTSLNAVAMSDTGGRLTYVNEAFAQLWGLGDAREALGRTADEFWANPGRARVVLGSLLAGERSWRGELVGRRHDGSTFDVDVWASAALDAGGAPIGLMASFLDVTERKRAAAELQRLNATLEARVQQRTHELARRSEELMRAEKLAALGSLVAGVAHELNTPIGNAVMVASTLAERRREFERSMAGGLRRSALDDFVGATREIAEVLERNLQRAADLIGSFKQVAVDQSSHQRRAFELSEVVHEIALALSPTLRSCGVTLAVEVPDGLAFDSFPGPIGQVLINLVNNAVLHGLDGRTDGHVRIAAAAAGDGRARIVVADDGCGIAPEHLNQIFDPFFTTRLGQGGSGLGLHIVYSLVTGPLGGRIEVASPPGRGTTFTIELPMTAPRT